MGPIEASALQRHRELKQKFYSPIPKAKPAEASMVPDFVVGVPASRVGEEPIKPRQTVRGITAVVCKRFGVSEIEIASQRRSIKVVVPRQIIMWLARKLTLQSMPQIGRVLGNRDHTTILSGVRKIDALRRADLHLQATLDDLEYDLTGELP